MTYFPNPGDQITIGSDIFTISQHPAAPGIAYGQEGRQGIVFKLDCESGSRALKVFKPRFRNPSLVSLTGKMAGFASLPGLQVCSRTVLNYSRHAELLKQHPNLTYAVLMPWVEGDTWQQILIDRRPLSPQQSLDTARELARLLSQLEENALAHCDLSGGNLILTPQGTIELVDVEGLCGPSLTRPEALPAGSPGYAHRTAPNGLWSRQADRFAGAVLLAEMLGWCDADIRQASWGENYFDPSEEQVDSQRYHLLLAALERLWGRPVAELLRSAWSSETLQDCPTLGEWLVALPDKVETSIIHGEMRQEPPDNPDIRQAYIGGILSAAQYLSDLGQHASAADVYRKALGTVESQSPMKGNLRQLILAEEQKARGEQNHPSNPANWICPTCKKNVTGDLAVCPYCEGLGSFLHNDRNSDNPAVLYNPEMNRLFLGVIINIFATICFIIYMIEEGVFDFGVEPENILISSVWTLIPLCLIGFSLLRRKIHLLVGIFQIILGISLFILTGINVQDDYIFPFLSSLLFILGGLLLISSRKVAIVVDTKWNKPLGITALAIAGLTLLSFFIGY